MPLVVVAETPASAWLDGAVHLLWFVYRHAVDIAVAKAQSAESAIVGVANAGSAVRSANLVGESPLRVWSASRRTAHR